MNQKVSNLPKVKDNTFDVSSVSSSDPKQTYLSEALPSEQPSPEAIKAKEDMLKEIEGLKERVSDLEHILEGAGTSGSVNVPTGIHAGFDHLRNASPSFVDTSHNIKPSDVLKERIRKRLGMDKKQSSNSDDHDKSSNSDEHGKRSWQKDYFDELFGAKKVLGGISSVLGFVMFLGKNQIDTHVANAKEERDREKEVLIAYYKARY